MAQASGELPSSMEEVEDLIAKLYRPGAAGDIVKTQEILQRLQRSPQGWQLANALLVHRDEQVRFFAALTFIVKLNTDAKSLSEEDAQALLQTLISWLIQCLEASEGPLVLRKLCSTLVAYFLQFSQDWSRCVKHILFCLCTGRAVPYSSLDDAPQTESLVLSISVAKAKPLFWFASTLVEEVGKIDSNSMKQNDFHRRVRPNVDDVVPLISKHISNREQSTTAIQQEALKCYQSWISYSHRSFIDSGGELEPLKQLIQPSLQCIMNNDLYEITMEIFTEILSNYSQFLQPANFNSLHELCGTSWSRQRYQNLIQGDYDFDSLQFGMFLLAFGDATVQDLTKNIRNPQCHQYLSVLSGLLDAEGYAVYEDKIYVPALEFWSTFVECMVDEVYTQEDSANPPIWFPAAQEHVARVIERCWRKSQFPPAKEFKSWDSVDQSAFKDARRDFSDLIQQFYLTTGLPLLRFWINQIPGSVASGNWLELESSLFCLTQLGDSVADTDGRNEYLDDIFTDSLMDLFTDPQQEIFTRTRKAFLDLVIGYADYFTHRPAKLPKVLAFSFGALSSPNLVHSASKTIVKLCSDCRKILLPELNGFLQHYGTLTSSNALLDGDVKEAVMKGIASLIQPMGSDIAKLAPLEQLLGYIEVDVDRSLSIASVVEPEPYPELNWGGDNNHEDVARELGLTALKCLIGISQGIQVPEDEPIDLEQEASSFWTTGKGSDIQLRIYAIICKVYDRFHRHGDIVEDACLIWRTGLREMEPGPFVFPPSTIAQFMMKANTQTPRLGKVLSTASSLITSKWTKDSEQSLAPLLSWVAQLLLDLGNPNIDTEISQAGIDYLTRFLPKYPQIVMAHQPPSSLEYLFMFTLEALKGLDPLPKASAAEFWATFLSLPSQSAPLQQTLDSALTHLGPLLTGILISQISGVASRSELDKLCEPLKKLITSSIHAKGWLENALLSIENERVGNKEKGVFLMKIVGLRGARGTNSVVREWWLGCRGSLFAYAS